MKARTLVILLALASTSSMCGLTSARVANRVASPGVYSSQMSFVSQPPGPNATAPARVDFTTQVKPIMQARCQPCHFQGGTVYGKLPFDRPETIKTLGEKLFTRLKEENDRRVIREFLAQ